MTTFNQAHHGDKIRICLPGGTTQPLRLLSDPGICADPYCMVLHSPCVDMEGHRVEALAYPGTEIKVIEYGPASELATRPGDVLAEHADAEDYVSADFAQRAEDDLERLAPTYRGGPELDEETEAHYRKERNT